ncbi:MAG: carbon monoxide dehydrogenase subunit G [Halomonas sp.]|uniref:CoxG family protein n=1 Tax=Halomonas sp. TaxID=1486246 RepID=UPI00286FD02D|nr:carbon monoxide dehydrogenase subunit G [Halomonas sp.]MDR9438365.1 carbon monoxide dehydrogenase subunit G [Halomonas sp.]
MEISGEHRIPAARNQVWEALNDPAVLQASIPGCEALDKESDTTFTARIVSKIGSIKARFNGKVDFSDINAPHSYTISGQGQGGMAGSAKGLARVELEESGPKETVLRYTANAEVAGKLASVGSRVIQGVVRKTADDFFRNFVEQVSGGQASADTAAGSAQPTAVIKRLGWIIAAGVLVAAAAGALMLL